MEKLSLVLWRERELLDTLLYRLEVERLLLAAGRTRWLVHATQDVEAVLSTLRETELLRAVAADEAAAALGLGTAPSLRSLVEAVEEPWRQVFTEHREAFLTLTREIAELAEANRGVLAAGYRSARETLRTVGGEDLARIGDPARSEPEVPEGADRPEPVT